MTDRKKRGVAFLATVGMVVVLGCNQSAPMPIPRDIGSAYIPAATGAATIDGVEFGYMASPERKAQIIDGFPKLKIGQSRKEAREAMGDPDLGQPSYGKESNALKGWHYEYRIKMRRIGPNTNDVYVSLFFDPDGTLHWAVPNKIPCLSEIGRPGRPATSRSGAAKD